MFNTEEIYKAAFNDELEKIGSFRSVMKSISTKSPKISEAKKLSRIHQTVEDSLLKNKKKIAKMSKKDYNSDKHSRISNLIRKRLHNQSYTAHRKGYDWVPAFEKRVNKLKI